MRSVRVLLFHLLNECKRFFLGVHVQGVSDKERALFLKFHVRLLAYRGVLLEKLCHILLLS
jgi:hypothetical protein